MTSTITDRIQGISTSVAVKAPVKAATTAAITLSGEQTIDGVACVSGDSVLVKDQGSSAANGIYYVSTTAWSRREDFDAGDDAVNGTTVYVLAGGTTNGGNWFQVTLAAVPPVIGTTTMTWAKTYVSLNAVTAATEGLAGVAKIATQAQTDTGTNDDAFITPLKLKTELTNLAYNIDLISSDAGATAAPSLTLTRNSASPAASDDLGQIVFEGKNTSAATKTYADIIPSIVDATAGSEDGLLHLRTVSAGTLARRVDIGAGMYMYGATGGDQGAGTINATQFYQNGVALANIAKIISVTASTPYKTNAALSVVIPEDNTIPTLTEGTQILTVTTSTTTNTQKIRLQYCGQGYTDGNTSYIATLNDGSTTIAATLARGDNSIAYTPVPITIDHIYSPAAVGTYTFNIRVGASSGSVYMNGTPSGRLFGGVMECTLVATVYEP